MFSQLSLVIWEDVKDIFVRYLGWLSKIDFLKSKSQPHLWLFSYSMWLFSAFFFLISESLNYCCNSTSIVNLKKMASYFVQHKVHSYTED